MRVLVVASFDSFLKAGVALARHLEALGARADHVLVRARKGQLSGEQLAAAGLHQAVPSLRLATLVTAERLHRYDVVVVALDGLRARRFLLRFFAVFEGAERRPVTVSLFPGVLFRYHLESMMIRSSCDLVLLGSRHDHALYSSMLRELGAERDNGLCAGLSFLPSLEAPADRDVAGQGFPGQGFPGQGFPGQGFPGQGFAERGFAKRGPVVFVDQPTVPATYAERLYVAERMVDLAERFPSARWLIKPRHRPGEVTLHELRFHYEDLLASLARRRALPDNLDVTYAPMPELLAGMRACITFSSTAAVEAAVRGIPTRIVSDLGVNEHLGNHLFLGSGMLADFDGIRPDMPLRLEAGWRAQHVASLADHVADVHARLQALLDEQRRLGQALPIPHGRLFARAPAYDAFVRRELGEAGLEAVGESGGTLQRWRERARRVWAERAPALLRRAR